MKRRHEILHGMKADRVGDGGHAVSWGCVRRLEISQNTARLSLNLSISIASVLPIFDKKGFSGDMLRLKTRQRAPPSAIGHCDDNILYVRRTSSPTSYDVLGMISIETKMGLHPRSCIYSQVTYELIESVMSISSSHIRVYPDSHMNISSNHMRIHP